eukprot:gene41786-51006_t
MAALATSPSVCELNSRESSSLPRAGSSKMQPNLSPRPSSSRLKSALSVLLSLDAEKADCRDADGNNWEGFLPSSIKAPTFYVENAYGGANTASSFYASYKSDEELWGEDQLNVTTVGGGDAASGYYDIPLDPCSTFGNEDSGNLSSKELIETLVEHFKALQVEDAAGSAVGILGQSDPLSPPFAGDVCALSP